jgi:hypothetical protein
MSNFRHRQNGAVTAASRGRRHETPPLLEQRRQPAGQLPDPGVCGDDVRPPVDGYLATLRHPESAGTLRVYAGPLRALAARFGEDADPAALDPQAVAEWFAGRWGERSAARWNGVLNTLR